jgi:hypothetical protein
LLLYAHLTIITKSEWRAMLVLCSAQADRKMTWGLNRAPTHRDVLIDGHMVEWMRSSRVVIERLTVMPKSQQFWVRIQHPPTQWNLESEGRHMKQLNKVQKKQKIPACLWLSTKAMSRS